MSVRRILRVVPLDRESVVHISASHSFLHAAAFYLIRTILAVVPGLDGSCRGYNFWGCESGNLLFVEWEEAEIQE